MKMFYVDSKNLDAFVTLGQMYPSATIVITKKVGRTITVKVIELSDLDDTEEETE